MKFSRALTLVGLLLATFFQGTAWGAERAVWQPSPGHAQIPIWPRSAPDAQPAQGAEKLSGDLVTNVTRPTMTVLERPPQMRRPNRARLQ